MCFGFSTMDKKLGLLKMKLVTQKFPRKLPHDFCFAKNVTKIANEGD